MMKRVWYKNPESQIVKDGRTGVWLVVDTSKTVNSLNGSAWWCPEYHTNVPIDCCFDTAPRVENEWGEETP